LHFLPIVGFTRFNNQVPHTQLLDERHDFLLGSRSN
jgi:hypothetical protein